MTQASDTSHCPVCGSTGKLAWRMPVDTQTLTATRHGHSHRCDACGLHYMWPRPTPEQTVGFYGQDYYTHEQDSAGTAQRPPFETKLRQHVAWRIDRGPNTRDAVAQMLGPAPKKVCDVGAGAGWLAAHLATLGHDVWCMERDPNAACFKLPRVRAVVGAPEAIPPDFERGSFDALVMSHVLEHLVDPVAALRELATLLKPRGHFYCAVPNLDSLAAGDLGLAWEHLDVPRHLCHFNAHTLAAAFERADYAVESVLHLEFVRMVADTVIDADQRRHDAIVAAGTPQGDAGARHSKAHAWALLARSALTPPPRRYEAVAVIARRH
jgi:2-polyprenyl-3-methyl-5-hydroxy-6-metoxy-1,4-benzoquinol methylase